MPYSDPELDSLAKKKFNVTYTLKIGGQRSEKQRDLSDTELQNGKVNLGDGKTRTLTAEEIKQKKYLVAKRFEKDELEAKQNELEATTRQFDERKEAIAANRQKEVLNKVEGEAKGLKEHVTNSASGTERVVKDHVSSEMKEVLRRIADVERKIPEPSAKSKRQKEEDDEKAILLATNPEAKKAFDEEWARKAEIALVRKKLAEAKTNLTTAKKQKDHAAYTEWKTKQEEAEMSLEALHSREKYEDAVQTWLKTPSKENEKVVVACEMEWQMGERMILEEQKKPIDAVKARLEGLHALAKQIEVDMTEQKELERELEEQEKRGAELRRRLGRDPLPSSGKGRKRGRADKEAKAEKRAKG